MIFTIHIQHTFYVQQSKSLYAYQKLSHWPVLILTHVDLQTCINSKFNIHFQPIDGISPFYYKPIMNIIDDLDLKTLHVKFKRAK